MTTIAWDGKTLAADRRVSTEGIFDCKMTKIHKRKDGSLVGACGGAALAAAFCRWVIAGEKGKRPELHAEKVSACGLIIRLNGNLILHDETGWFEADPGQYAMGSGWEIALSAMRTGNTAVNAVKIAEELDGGTGCGVDALELGK